MRSPATFILLLLALAPGCDGADGDAGDASPTTVPSLRRLLAQEQELVLVPEGSGLALETIAAAGGVPAPTHAVLHGGRLRLRAAADGALVIDSFAVGVADLFLRGDGLPPDGIHLAGIEARLPGAVTAAAVWSDDGLEAAAAQAIDLEVDWALAPAFAAPVPLAPLRLRGLDLELRAGASEAAEPEVRLTVSARGDLWQVPGIVRLAGVALDTRWRLREAR